MTDRLRTRIVHTSAWGPQLWVLQAWFPTVKVWADIGDPHETRTAALVAEQAFQRRQTERTEP